jgi:hypothetical protein
MAVRKGCHFFFTQPRSDFLWSVRCRGMESLRALVARGIANREGDDAQRRVPSGRPMGGTGAPTSVLSRPIAVPTGALCDTHKEG